MANRRFFGNHDLKDIGSATANTYFQIKTVGADVNFYVNGGTGSDTNDGSVGSPFATIQKALDTVAASLRTGSVQINVADGTYNENLFFKSYIGGAPDSGSAFTSGLNPSLIYLVGNTATPANVVIQGDDTQYAAVQVVGCSAAVYLDGVQIETTTPANFTVGLYVESSTVLLGAVNIINAGSLIIANYKGIVFLDDVVNGGTFTATYNGFIATWSSIIQSFRSVGFTITGFDTAGIAIGQNSVFNSYYGFTLTADAGGATDGILCIENAAIELGGILSETVNITDCTNAFRITRNASFDGALSSTYNITDCTNPINLQSGAIAVESLGFDNTWNYLGTTNSIIKMPPGTQALSPTNFDGATYNYIELDTNYRYGFDDRYSTNVLAYHPGVLPSNSTVYFTGNGVQANYIPLFISGAGAGPDTREIVELTAISRVSNGGAATDTYTVYINGIATALTATMSNSTIASGTATGVVMSGLHNTLAVRVTTDAVGTAAEDVTVRVRMINK